jgi:hypothetical protein
MHILYPHEVKQEGGIAPIELDDDLAPRDSWMFAPLIAAVVVLPILATAAFGISVFSIANRDEASSSAPPATFASRWPEQTLPVIR